MSRYEKIEEMVEDKSHPSSLYSDRQRWIYLAILFSISTMAFLDRSIITVLLEPIKQEFGVSDTALGFLSGVSFALFYATLGIPVAYWADRGNRKTIITLAISIWSLMTAVCGAAASFLQLILARVLVGVGEAGAQPPAQSLVADYFSPETRGRAMSILLSSAAVGNLLGFVVGGQVSAEYGWRVAFVVAGLPGLLLAVVCYFFLREPRLEKNYVPVNSVKEKLSKTVRTLQQKKSYMFLGMAVTSYFFVAYGSLSFTPSYLIRVLEIDLVTASTYFGAVNVAATLVGTIAGGVLVDKLQKRDRRWVFWMPSIGLLLTLPFMVAQYLVADFNHFLILTGMGLTIFMGVVPAIWVAIHQVCGSSRRTVAIAFVYLLANLVGVGGGPAVAGLLSDVYGVYLGDLGLRYALVSIAFVLIPAAWVTLQSARHFEADMEA